MTTQTNRAYNEGGQRTMTLQELYTNIDGNYDHAVQIMKTDWLIDK